MDRVLQAVKHVAAERRKRVTTGQMNRFVENVDFERASVPMSRRMRILYMTQAAVGPPMFVLFTDRDVSCIFPTNVFWRTRFARRLDLMARRFALRFAHGRNVRSGKLPEFLLCLPPGIEVRQGTLALQAMAFFFVADAATGGFVEGLQ